MCAKFFILRGLRIGKEILNCFDIVHIVQRATRDCGEQFVCGVCVYARVVRCARGLCCSTFYTLVELSVFFSAYDRDISFFCCCCYFHDCVCMLCTCNNIIYDRAAIDLNLFFILHTSHFFDMCENN